MEVQPITSGGGGFPLSAFSFLSVNKETRHTAVKVSEVHLLIINAMMQRMMNDISRDSIGNGFPILPMP